MPTTMPVQEIVDDAATPKVGLSSLFPGGQTRTVCYLAIEYGNARRVLTPAGSSFTWATPEETYCSLHGEENTTTPKYPTERAAVIGALSTNCRVFTFDQFRDALTWVCAGKPES